MEKFESSEEFLSKINKLSVAPVNIDSTKTRYFKSIASRRNLYSRLQALIARRKSFARFESNRLPTRNATAGAEDSLTTDSARAVNGPESKCLIHQLFGGDAHGVGNA